VRNTCPCRGERSRLLQWRNLGSPLNLASPIDLLHDAVPLSVVRECSLGAEESLARLTDRGSWYRPHCDLDLLALDQSDLLKCRATVLHDLGGDHAGIFEVGRVFEAVVLEREDVETEYVALRELVIPVWPP
jgi:hypothetical protein